MSEHVFTSEAVAEGHPDKVADRISDEILDAVLRVAPKGRVAAETLVTKGLCVVAGEVTGPNLDWASIAREAIRDIGYGDPDFDADTVDIDVRIHRQAAEIAKGVDAGGAGDQGLMFGYACRETPDLMPAPIHYAHAILRRMAELRRGGERRLGPDAKSQVSLQYADGCPRRVHTVVLSHMHTPALKRRELEQIVRAILPSVFPAGWVDRRTKILVNPAGTFHRGGPGTDTGLTGRKIIVDTYGGAAPHGGGAFSGKDPTKVDRSAAYAARWLAKNIVAAGIAERCTIQIAYAIGVAEPVSLMVDTHGTGTKPDGRIEDVLRSEVPLTPRAIIQRLGLRRPIYARTAAGGHFGRPPDRDGGFSWERTDLVAMLEGELA